MKKQKIVDLPKIDKIALSPLGMAQLQEKIPLARVIEKLDYLLDATKTVYSRESGLMEIPDNPSQIKAVECVLELYDVKRSFSDAEVHHGSIINVIVQPRGEKKNVK